MGDLLKVNVNAGLVDCADELAMLKAALLYADRVAFSGTSAWCPLVEATQGDLDLKRKLACMLLASLIDRGGLVASAQVRSMLEEVGGVEASARFGSAGLEEEASVREIAEFVESGWAAHVETFNYVLTADSRARDYLVARDSGFVEFRTCADYVTGARWDELDEGDPWVESIQVAYGNALVGRLLETLSDEASLPMYSPLVCDILQLLRDRYGLTLGSSASTRHAKEVRLAHKVLSRLPSFESATVDEILDIRNDLADSLVQFRACVMRLSADDTVSEDLTDVELSDLERREIEPAVQQIEQQIRENGCLRKLAKTTARKPLLPAAGSAVSLMIGQLAHVSPESAAAVGLLGGMSTVALEAYDEWRATHDRISSSPLYFYYRAGRLLEDANERRRFWEQQ